MLRHPWCLPGSGRRAGHSGPAAGGLGPAGELDPVVAQVLLGVGRLQQPAFVLPFGEESECMGVV